MPELPPYLKVASRFLDFLEELLEYLEGERVVDAVDEQEGVGVGDGEATHRWKLHVAARVQKIDLSRTISGVGERFKREKT